MWRSGDHGGTILAYNAASPDVSTNVISCRRWRTRRCLESTKPPVLGHGQRFDHRSPLSVEDLRCGTWDWYDCWKKSVFTSTRDSS